MYVGQVHSCRCRPGTTAAGVNVESLSYSYLQLPLHGLWRAVGPGACARHSVGCERGGHGKDEGAPQAKDVQATSRCPFSPLLIDQQSMYVTALWWYSSFPGTNPLLAIAWPAGLVNG